ncbi:MAG: ATP-binding protein [Halodesulfurarchaeum sp.]
MASEETQPTDLLTLVSNPGDRRVLRDWIESESAYEPAEEAGLQEGRFDCCLLDPENLQIHEKRLAKHKQESLVPLPVILLVAGERVATVRRELKAAHPGRWELLDGVLRTPMSEAELETQVDSLIRLRRQAQANRRQEEQLKRIRDEHAGHGVLITDRDGAIQYANRAFEIQSGYDFESIEGETPRLLQSGEHDEAFYRDLWETIRRGDVWNGVVTNKRKDGRRYVLDQTIAPMHDADGEIDQFVAINHEITELKVLEERLRERGEQLALLNRVLRHDVRNDMTVIKGWAQTIDPHGDEATREIIDRIVSASTHVIELTISARDLIEAIDSGAEPELEQVDIGEILEEEVRKRQERYEFATIEVESQGAEYPVLANELLASVFRNLINNAIQHHDSQSPHVWISIEQSDSHITVDIADDGPGINPSFRDRLFEAEAKGLDSTGTGMGLYLVDRVMKIFDGDVRVVENRPRGTRFVLTFPMATPRMAAEEHS